VKATGRGELWNLVCAKLSLYLNSIKKDDQIKVINFFFFLSNNFFSFIFLILHKYLQSLESLIQRVTNEFPNHNDLGVLLLYHLYLEVVS
jgi:hypothetical protein